MSTTRPWVTLVLTGTLLSLGGGARAQEPAAGTHDLMPVPARLEWRDGRLPVDARFTMAATGAPDPRTDAALRRTRARLEGLTGLRLPAVPVRPERAVLVVETKAAGRPVQSLEEDESYELTVSPRQVLLVAGNPLGVLRGLETLLQLPRPEGGRHVLPAVAIQDQPRFPWRGLMLDPCRRWEPVEMVKRTLDGMAAVKLNVLHWHLSEDQGFRIESRLYPALHQKASDGRYYTQDQVREVIAYARERGIRVVPEFDVPGHSTSWLVAHPELGSAPGPFELVRRWGIFDNNLDPSREEVYAFLERFFGEMAALFPDLFFHIGGDEVTARQWNANPAILDFMYRHDLNGAAELQAHFNRRLGEILTRHGKRMVGWDEILSPDLPPSIVVHSWRGPKALARAAELGYDGLLSSGYYLDLSFPARAHYLADPIPPDSTLGEEARRHVLGGEGCMWSEFVSPENIDSRLWPRAAAIAERLWSPSTVRDVDDMYRRMEIESARLEALGLSHRRALEEALPRLAAGGPTEPLRVLAEVLEPVKEYRRGALLAYTSDMPLDRLVDAVRPESLPARRFRRDVDRLLAAEPASRDDAALRASLEAWRANHDRLDPVLAASPKVAEARSLSRDLSRVAAAGLEALDAVRAGRAPAAAWTEKTRALLAHAAKPRAEMELAILPGVRKLALAAALVDEAKTMPLEEWNRRLDQRLEAEARPADAH